MKLLLVGRCHKMSRYPSTYLLLQTSRLIRINFPVRMPSPPPNTASIKCIWLHNFLDIILLAYFLWIILKSIKVMSLDTKFSSDMSGWRPNKAQLCAKLSWIARYKMVALNDTPKRDFGLCLLPNAGKRHCGWRSEFCFNMQTSRWGYLFQN